MLRPGAVIAHRYVVLQPLGEGTTAVVYRACDRSEGREVALKVLRGEFSDDADIAGRFEREAVAMQALRHPCIVAVYDHGRHDGHLWFAMELLKGGNLADLLKRRGRLPPREAIPIAMDVLKGLEVAHAAKVVHRDIKPGNILLTPSGAKLTDFGIAQLRSEEHCVYTKAGVAIGTLSYMAPEQISDSRGVDRRADLYAVAATLYRMVVGKRPAGLYRERGGASIPEWVEGDLHDVIDRGAKMLPEDRFDTAKDMGHALAVVLGRLAPPPVSEPVRMTSRAPFSSAARIAALVGLAAICMAVVGTALAGGIYVAAAGVTAEAGPTLALGDILRSAD